MTDSVDGLQYMSLSAILFAAFIHFLLGGLWYGPSPMFGSYFMELAFGPNKRPKPDPRPLAAAALGALIHAPVMCLFLSCLDVRNANEGCLWGLAFAIFSAGLHVSHGFFEERPFALFVLHQGYHTVSLIAQGGILGFVYGQ